MRSDQRSLGFRVVIRILEKLQKEYEGDYEIGKKRKWDNNLRENMR